MTSPGAATHNDTRPCVGCGMCCDGTLYDVAKVAPGEDRAMRSRGLEIIEVGNKAFFRQPCPMESGGRCTIYEHRFGICRSFSCALLKRYHAGELTLEETTEKVATAKRLLAIAVADNPNASRADARRRIRAASADLKSIPDEQLRLKSAKRLLNLIAVDAYLDKWFRNKNFQVHTIEEAGADSNS